MKIIHTADWHLGQTFYSHDRSKEHAVFLDWLCNTINERGTELLLIAGDVFDSPNPSAEAQKMYYHFLKRVTEENRDIQVIATAGNHDSAARIEAPAPLLNIFNVHVSGIVHYVDTEIDYDRMIIPLASGGCCLAVPYLRHNDHPEAENYSAGVGRMYSELYERAVKRGYSPIIAMGHLQASGAQVSVGDSSEHIIIGGMEGIGEQFINEGIAYTALGHLHKAQRVANKENIRYSGSPLPMSFAERGNKQSVTEVIIENGECHIEKIAFTPPVALLSVPEKPQPIDVVLEELSALPDGEQDCNSPYLEVRVLITTVDPTIRQRIEEAVEGKAVRLTRVECTSNITRDGDGSTPMSYEDFKKIEPVALMKDIYNKECNEELPEELGNLLEEIIKEAKL